MRIWNSFPMLRLVVPFVIGVISWAFLLEEVEVAFVEFVVYGLVACSVICLAALSLVNFGRRPFMFGLLLVPLLYALGALLTVSVSNYIYPESLNQFRTSKFSQSYIAVVADQPQVKEKSVKIVADVATTDWQGNGKVLLYFEKDSASKKLKYGQEILIRTKLQKVEGMGNPNEFNYSRYLRFHGIIFRGYVKSTNWQSVSSGKPGITGWFLSLRSNLISKFEQAGLEGNELSVASALVLGYRTELDKELMSAYAGAGATHVLAVSGLHVGIVYVILSTLLKFMDKRKSLRILKTVILVFLLFGYAGLTGLSASVFRAATMFSFVAVGKAIDRNTNIFNTLAASAFCLILYEPMIVMQVGFQLSYLAVIGIVVIQPRLFQLKAFNNRLADWIWSITCVSIAAQIATFPLGLLYFHQFPNLFLISNLLVIPAAAMILYLGFSLFIATIWKPTLLFFGFLLNTVIATLNQVVLWIEQIPYSVLSGIDISTLEALMIYALIILVLVFIIYQQRFAVYVGLALSIVFMILQIAEVGNQKNQEFAVVYNVKGETAIALVNGANLKFIASKKLWNNEQAMLFHVRHHWWNRGIETETFVELNDSLVNRRLEWNGNSFVILDLKKPGNGVVVSGGSKKLDYVFLDKSNWNSSNILEELRSDSVILANSFGPKMIKRIQGVTHGIPTIVLAETGMIEL